jgi:ribonuclease Z
MASSFRTFLVNDLFGDPALYVALPWERRALLFDLGDVTRLSAGRLLKLTDIFVSHAHVDHFVGFDHVLRVLLGRSKALRVYGPPGFIDHVEGKLHGYTWNLVEGYSLVIDVHEVHPGAVRRARFACPEGFLRREAAATPLRAGVMLEEPQFRVRVAHLDHRIPCLGFALEESIHLNVDKAALGRLGLPVGPWLIDLKRAVRDGLPDQHLLRAVWSQDGTRQERTLRLGELRSQVIRESPGQKIAYVTDVLGSEENAEKIVELATGADILYCEAAYPERDRERAAARYHLTAMQAGRLAARANVRRLVVFHFSPKYRDSPGVLLDEALGAFAHREAT